MHVIEEKLLCWKGECNGWHFANIAILKNAIITIIKLPQNSNVIFCKIGLCSRTGKINQNPPSGRHLTSYPTSSSPSKPPCHCQLFINTCSLQQCAQTFPIKVIPGDSVGLFEILVIFGILTKWCHSSISDEGDTQIQTNISLHDLDNVSSHGGAYWYCRKRK